MAFVLTFPKHRLSRSRTAIRCNALQRLNVGLFVDAERMDAMRFAQRYRFAVGSTDLRDSLIEVGIGFVFAGQPVLLLMRPDCSPAKQLANPTTTYRSQQTFELQLQRQFPVRPLGNRSIAVLWVFTRFLKIVACYSGEILGLRPDRCRSESSFWISCSRTCGFSAHSISIRRCQSSRHRRRHAPTASC